MKTICNVIWTRFLASAIDGKPASWITPCILFLACCSTVSAEIPIPANPFWSPVRDEVYLQEVGRKIETEEPVLALAVLDGVLYAADHTGVQRLEGDQLVLAGGPRIPIRRLKVSKGMLWALGDNGLWRFADGVWSKLGDGVFVDLCLHGDAVVVASPTHLYQVEGDRLARLDEDQRIPQILGVASYSETLYVRHTDRLSFLQNGQLHFDDVEDWGHLPLGSTTRDILSVGSRLLVATDRGLAVLRGMSWYHFLGKDGLCYEDTTCVSPGFDSDFWIGTTRGAIRAVGGEYHYFGYERWIPHDKVNAVACGDNIAYIATDGGLGIIAYQPYTLRKKAAWYEWWLDQWGQKRMGFVHQLVWVPERGEYVRFLSDNDVGWACHYLNAMCFKYAVAKDPQARAEAINVFKAVKWSEEITPIDGFPARAIYAVGENAIKAKTGSAGLPAEWNPTPDGRWEWKGDTSSDEVDAHVYSVSLFLELVAQGKERSAAQEHLQRVIGHIIDNGWVLRDLDGKPTRWARWDPDYLQRPYGYYARGLNGMEALNYTTTAFALTGNQKFEQGKKQLLAWGYHNESLRQKLVFTEVTHFDDRLAFLTYHPLLRYERDPTLRSIFRRSLERSWEIKRIESVPWFSFIYGALTGNECENGHAVQHLREWPLDCLNYRHANSHRHDLQVPPGRRNYVADWKPMTPRDIGPKRWDRDVLELDGGGGKGVLDPSGWLDAYWMGRYYGFIEAPTATDQSLLTVETPDVQLGASPYDGPPRPDIFGL